MKKLTLRTPQKHVLAFRFLKNNASYTLPNKSKEKKNKNKKTYIEWNSSLFIMRKDDQSFDEPLLGQRN